MEEAWVPDATDARDLDDMWNMWDQDGSGTLDEYEFIEVLKSIGLDDLDEAVSYFSQIDAPGLGEISKEQFKIWFLRADLKSDKKASKSHAEEPDVVVVESREAPAQEDVPKESILENTADAAGWMFKPYTLN